MGAVDDVIVALAARQHGVVATWQLAERGVSREAIRHRVARGWLTVVHRGVYRVGPVEAPRAKFMAAVLAAGPTAVVSHHSAAELHGFRPARAGDIDVTVKRKRNRRPGIRIHRTRRLEPSDVTHHDAVPVTTPARTIRDLAPALSLRDLERTIEEAQIQKKLDRLSLTDVVDQARGKPGATALRAAATQADPQLTRSEAERRMLELIRRAGLPRPRTNARLGPWEVDLYWPERRLVVEVDGFAFHATRAAFERDRRKDAELDAMGISVRRLTWRQLTREPEAVVARLARALA